MGAGVLFGGRTLAQTSGTPDATAARLKRTREAVDGQPRRPVRFFMRKPSFIACLAFVLVSACGGGGSSDGGGGEPVGVALPAQTSVVPIQTAAVEGDEPAWVASFAPETDYRTAVARVRVHDPGLVPFARIDRLLGLVRQVGAVELVNRSPYLAQVAPPYVAPGSEVDPALLVTGRSGGARAPRFELWTVRNTRASNQAPHELELWIPGTGAEGEALEVRVASTAAVDAWSFGSHRIDVAGFEPRGAGAPTFRLSLETGRASGGLVSWYRYFESQGDLAAVPAAGEAAVELAITAEVNAGGSTGRARVFRRRRFDDGAGDSGIVPEEHWIRFDATTLLRATNGGTRHAFERQNFDEHVWRYGLFDATTGERVPAGAGFSFLTEAQELGWVDADGLWVPAGTSVAHGDTVRSTVLPSEAQEAEDFSVVLAPGRLVRHVRRPLDLIEIADTPFEWIERNEPEDSVTRWRLVFDVGTATWWKSARHDPDSGPDGGAWVALDPFVAVDTAAVGWLQLWSERFGGLVSFVHGDTTVATFASTPVDGGDALFADGDTAVLFGFVDCLRAELTAAEVEVGDVLLPAAPDVATPHRFEFHRDDLALFHDAGTLAPVGLAAEEPPPVGPWSWGLASGPLVVDGSGFARVQDVWNAPEFFTWETGPNPWNRTTALRRTDESPVRFEAPLTFVYVHATENDRNGDATYAGQSFVLRWLPTAEGGELVGLPRAAVDTDFDLVPDRVVPLVNLADGTRVGPTGVEYVVKALDLERALREDPASVGAFSLVPASDLVLAGPADLEPVELGPVPTVTEAPRVVAGRLVEAPSGDTSDG